MKFFRRKKDKPSDDQENALASIIRQESDKYQRASAQIQNLSDIAKFEQDVKTRTASIISDCEADAYRVLASRSISEGGYRESIEFLKADISLWEQLYSVKDLDKIPQPPPNCQILIRILGGEERNANNPNGFTFKSISYKYIPDAMVNNLKSLLTFDKAELQIMGVRIDEERYTGYDPGHYTTVHASYSYHIVKNKDHLSRMKDAL